jgi:hypothetical protein
LTARRLARLGAAVAGTPSLWRTAIRQWRRTTPPGWWRRRPFLPVPPAEYLHFRLVTQYGDADHPVEPADVLNYLAWCKLQER